VLTLPLFVWLRVSPRGYI